MGLLFFPRGGSSHVAREPRRGAAGGRLGRRPSCPARCASPAGPATRATSTRGLDVHTVDFTAALDAPDPMLADPPFHPSYEDRPGRAGPRSCARSTTTRYQHQVAAWARALAAAGAAERRRPAPPPPDAAQRGGARASRPDVPVVGHLHGTELLMLEEIEAHGRRWPLRRRWVERMRGWAAGCERLIVLSESQVARAERLLGDRPRALRARPQRLRPDVFERRADRRGWRTGAGTSWTTPQGWAPGGEPGSVALHGRRTSRRSPATAPCCSTSAASRRSSACRC